MLIIYNCQLKIPYFYAFNYNFPRFILNINIGHPISGGVIGFIYYEAGG